MFLTMIKNAIVLVPFPFDDISDTKVRPTLCLPKNKTEESIQAGLQDLKDIISGKIKGKSIKQLLNDD